MKLRCPIFSGVDDVVLAGNLKKKVHYAADFSEIEVMKAFVQPSAWL